MYVQIEYIFFRTWLFSPMIANLNTSLNVRPAECIFCDSSHRVRSSFFGYRWEILFCSIFCRRNVKKTKKIQYSYHIQSFIFDRDTLLWYNCYNWNVAAFCCIKLIYKIYICFLQDLKTDKDEEHCRKINDVLNNPPTPGSQRSGGANPEGDLQNLLNNMSQQQLIQLFGGVGQIGGLGSLLGTMNRPHGVQSTRASTTTSSTPATTNVTRASHSLTPGPVTDSSKSSSKLIYPIKCDVAYPDDVLSR